jgi:ABC-type antimicrobial peptide transport system permease subunit
VRLALGASRRQLIASMTASARGAVIAGLGAGVALASVSGGPLRHRLYGLSPADPAAYASAALIFVLAAAAATFIPLRRALRVDPAVTLRSE